MASHFLAYNYCIQLYEPNRTCRHIKLQPSHISQPPQQDTH